MKIFLGKILHILIEQKFFHVIPTNDEKFKLLENQKTTKMRFLVFLASHEYTLALQSASYMVGINI